MSQTERVLCQEGPDEEHQNGAILAMDGLDEELADSLEQILFDEERAVEELNRLLA